MVSRAHARRRRSRSPGPGMAGLPGVLTQPHPLRGALPSGPQNRVTLWPRTSVGSRAAVVPVLAVGLRPGTRLRRQPRGRFEPELAVVPVQPPSVVVDEVVAAFAQQAQVVDVGGSAAGEPFDVVGFASLRGGGTVGAAAIAGRQYDPLAGTGSPVGSSQPQRVAVGIEDGRQDPSVSRQPGDLVGGDGQAVVIAQVLELA